MTNPNEETIPSSSTSKTQRKRNDAIVYFFKLIKMGSVDDLEEFLKSEGKFDINSRNYKGQTGLQAAIQYQDENVITFLLKQPNIDLTNIILYAIREQNVEIVYLLLEKLHEINPSIEFGDSDDDFDFNSGITPLMLAAHLSDIDIIFLLLARGHSIKRPHRPDCFCEAECKQRRKGETLEKSLIRVNRYRAITDPVFMCYTSFDPILDAFLLCKELKDCSNLEGEFKDSYTEMIRKLHQFSSDLVSQCNTTDQVLCLLKQQEGFERGYLFLFPRLMLAMDCKQKEFVTHPYIQQFLNSTWYGETQIYRSLGTVEFLILTCILIPFLPLISLIIVSMPRSYLGRILTSPISKCQQGMSSYIFFLFIILCEIDLENISWMSVFPPDIRTAIFHSIVSVWILGFIAEEFRELQIMGLQRFLASLWTWYDITMISLFLGAIICWFIQLISVSNDKTERKYWSSYDPRLVEEGLFAVAMIFSFGRLLYICQLNHFLGPLQVTMGRMVIDICKCMSLFFVIMLSFASGLNQLYEYYKGMIRYDTKLGEQKVQVESFVTFSSTIKTLFWAIFAMSPVESADVIISNFENANENTTGVPEVIVTEAKHHYFTQFIGYLLFGSFHIITIIICLNLLIAIMASSFEKVKENADREWKNARTEVWVHYFDKDTRLPSPFNLFLPNLSFWKSVFLWVKYRMTGNTRQFSYIQRMFSNNYSSLNTSEGLQYEELINHLVKRYLHFKERNNGKDNLSISDYKNLVENMQEMKSSMTRQRAGGLKSWSQIPSNALSWPRGFTNVRPQSLGESEVLLKTPVVRYPESLQMDKSRIIPNQNRIATEKGKTQSLYDSTTKVSPSTSLTNPRGKSTQPSSGNLLSVPPFNPKLLELSSDSESQLTSY